MLFFSSILSPLRGYEASNKQITVLWDLFLTCLLCYSKILSSYQVFPYFIRISILLAIFVFPYTTETSKMLKLIPFFVFAFLSMGSQAQINTIVKPGGFLFMDGKDSICFYQKSPKDKGGEYSRCNYIHPLYGSDGTRLTEDFPADHLHHRGLFWAWHQILIDNIPVSDGWELKNFQQKVASVEFIRLHELGILTTIVNWSSPLWKNGTEAYLQEKTKITMYPLTGNYRRMDFEIQLKALTDRLSIGGSDDEKGYSGFSVRLKLPTDVQFSGINGSVEPVNTAVDAGNIMNISGSFLKDGKKGGLAIWSNPENPDPSTLWILRNSASMQNAAFPGRHAVSIPFDQPLTLKYSVLVYLGELTPQQINRVIK